MMLEARSQLSDILGSLWAITTYYNPAKYQQRLANYRIFRKNLIVPLLTVELSFNTDFELHRDDADVLVQIQGGAVLWQKERLLNVGLRRLPQYVTKVAWLDCDIVFANTEWPMLAHEALKASPKVQLFARLYDLERSESPSNVDLPSRHPSGLSVAYMMATNKWSHDDFRPPSTIRLRHCLFGLAWAARRELLDAHGFYDAMILGSGNRAMACAALGRYDDAIHTLCLDRIRAKHYLEWAEPYYKDIQGNVANLDGVLFHLWHGDLVDRKYVERHAELSKFFFDPRTDISIAPNGCWVWATRKQELHECVRSYFFARNEDGRPGR